jgi:predicted Ser/Thr protein kinase
MLGPGDVIGGFVLEGLLGRGGMGVVYRARQLDLDRLVALKVISPEWAQDSEFRARFRREARLAAAVEHPNVLPVYEAGEKDGVLYLAMRLVEGADLDALVRHSGPLQPARAVQIIRQVAAALDAAHARGLIHRDVKPRNVLVADEHAYLADFGVARRADTGATLTGPGGWAGSVDYAAPEQIRGEQPDARSDIYALGGVLFWAVTGRVPFPRETPEATLWAHVTDAPPRASAVMPGLPSGFDPLIQRALAKARADRYRSAGELAAAADGAAAAHAPPAPDTPTLTSATHAPPSSPPVAAASMATPAPLRRSRPRFVLIALAATALAAAAAVGVTLGTGALQRPGHRRSRTPAAASRGRARRVGKPYDFDGDGRQDIAVGIPGLRHDAGAVAVLAGSAGGMSRRARLLSPSSAGVPERAEPFAHFGDALASADFNGDGYADLAVGAPGERSTRAGRAGAVTVLYGSPHGPGARHAELFLGPSTGAGFGDTRYGAALVAGDLNGDRFGDLVIGAPGADPRPEADIGSGSVRMLFGGPAGLTGAGARTLRRPRAADADFGSLLALGKVDGDRRPDLVEGAPGGEAQPGLPAAPGHASYCAGTRSGPVRCRAMDGASPGGPASLAIGDVTGDGLDDVVEGVPVNGEINAQGAAPAGAVVLRRGTRRGPAHKAMVITQDSPGVKGHNQPSDAFGAAVEIADLDHDGYADIVVGAPGEDSNSGRLTVIRGAPDGYSETGGHLYAEETPGIPGAKVPDDRFAAVLSSLDANGDGLIDVVVGEPGERRGAVKTLPGGPHGLDASRARSFALQPLGPAGPGSPQMTLGRQHSS